MTNSATDAGGHGATHTRVAELDLLRFLAAVSVTLYHRARDDVTMFGFLGVHLFFIISGFVILWTALNKTPLQFVASRFSRLYPSFLICLFITAGLMLLAGLPVSLMELAANVTMLPGAFHQPAVDGVYWTLAVELKFYVLIFLLLLGGQLPHIERWLALWLTLSTLNVLSTVGGFPPPLAAIVHYLSLEGYAPFFIAGCYFYLIHSRPRSALRLPALALSLLLAVAVAVRGQRNFTLHGQTWVAVCVGALILTEYAALYAVATRRWQLPNLRLWYVLGSMTFPLYLIHHKAGNVVDDWLADHDLAAPLRLVLVLLIVLLGSCLLGFTVEQRLCGAVYRFLTLHAWPRAARIWRGPSNSQAAG